MVGIFTHANITQNESLKLQDRPLVVIITVAVCYGTCIWTMLIHGLLILCFYMNRKAVWINQAKGMLSLIVTDFLSGISFFILISIQFRVSVQRYACVFPAGNYLAIQLLMSLQILRLCIYRLTLVMRNSSQHTEKTNRLIVQFVVLFFVSFAVVATSSSWIQWKDIYNPCTLKHLVGKNMKKACIFLLLIFSVPNFLTTCIYFIIMCLLKTKSVSVFPVTQLPADFVKGRDGVLSDEIERRGNPHSKEREHSSRKAEIFNFNLAMKRYWQKAVVTIGLILLLNNISVFPYVTVLSYQIASGEREAVPAFLWFGSGFFLQINSAVSPFVYVLRVNVVNVAFRKMLKKICCIY